MMRHSTPTSPTPEPQNPHPHLHPDAAAQPAPPTSVNMVAAVLATSSALAACGGGGSGGASSANTPVIAGRTIVVDTSGYTQLTFSSDTQAARFLQQAQFSSSEADIAQVEGISTELAAEIYRALH